MDWYIGKKQTQFGRRFSRTPVFLPGNASTSSRKQILGKEISVKDFALILAIFILNVSI